MEPITDKETVLLLKYRYILFSNTIQFSSAVSLLMWDRDRIELDISYIHQTLRNVGKCSKLIKFSQH